MNYSSSSVSNIKSLYLAAGNTNIPGCEGVVDPPSMSTVALFVCLFGGRLSMLVYMTMGRCHDS